jgi:hypothetical protein
VHDAAYAALCEGLQPLAHKPSRNMTSRDVRHR